MGSATPEPSQLWAKPSWSCNRINTYARPGQKIAEVRVYEVQSNDQVVLLEYGK